MRSVSLPPHVQAKIDQRVDRLLQDLGDPTPPLSLEVVRDCLRLDLAFYSGGDADLLARAVHRLKVGAKQVIARPMLMIDAIKKFNLRALYEPDRKRILIDSTVPKPKHRWLAAHEVVHSLLPWHGSILFGDDDITPTVSCHAKVELEANYGAGQLLFLRRRFLAEAMDLPLTFQSIKSLAGTYGNTHASTLWRTVELLGSQRPLLGVISCHPHFTRRPADFDPTAACQHLIQSPAFALRFGKVSEGRIFDRIVSYCGAQKGGPLGQSEIILDDDWGCEHEFASETFYNGHNALTLMSHVRQMPTVVIV